MRKIADAPEELPLAAPLARHLAVCDGCRAAWLGRRRFSAELRQALIVPAAPEGFEERAWSRMPRVRRQHRISSVRALACAAALATAAVAGLILMRHGPARDLSQLADSSHAAPLLPPAVKSGLLHMLEPGSQTGPHPLSPSPNPGGGGTKHAYGVARSARNHQAGYIIPGQR
jgi:hypothetical protein